MTAHPEVISTRGRRARRGPPSFLNTVVVVALVACASSSRTTPAVVVPPPAAPPSPLASPSASARPEGVDHHVRLLTRPIAQQNIDEARAAAVALGALGDASPPVVDALVYGLYLNIRTATGRGNIFYPCVDALVRLGADAAVPRLMSTISEGNASVNDLLRSYETEPGMPPVPPGFLKSQAIDAMRLFADARTIGLLLGLVRDRQEPANVRAAAAETAAHTALRLPREDPRRGEVFEAIVTALNEAAPATSEDMAPSMAPAIALLGDPRAPGVLMRRIASRALAAPDAVAFRMSLLQPLAMAVRHADVAAFDRLADATRRQLEGLLRQYPDAEGEVRPVLEQLATIRATAAPTRDCDDGQLACYQRHLQDPDPRVVRKAAYLIAWAGGENADARAALLARADIPDVFARRAVHTAIEALSPRGCGECATRLAAIVEGERDLESRRWIHLEARTLIARLRVRNNAP